MRRLLQVVLLLGLTAAACSSPKPSAAPDPTVAETSTASATNTTPPPASSTTSTSVKPSSTTSTVPRTTVTSVLTLGPGNATLTGTVTGPQGPVDGATVRVERLVGKSVVSADVGSVGGSWSLASILGGSYRVRAFRTPDLVASEVQTFFLAANERKVVDFKLTATGGDRITAVINPNPPKVDQTALLTVTVGIARVDDQGRPAITPRAGVLLTLSPDQGHAIESAPQVLTDGNGNAAWRIRCLVEGASAIPLTVGTGTTSIRLPPCGAAPPPPATTTTRSG